MGKRKNGIKKTKSPHKDLKKECDELWSLIIKMRARFRCEYTGANGKQIDRDGVILHSHHIYGKSTYAYRYDLNNGICLDSKIHKWYAHGTPEKQEQFRDFIKDVRGENFYEKMKVQTKTSTTLPMYKAFLEQELEKLKKKHNGHKW